MPVKPLGTFMGLRGQHVYTFSDPHPSSFEPEPVAHTLANIARYAGNCGRYTVAQHAVLVARVVAKRGGFPPQILAALHHDDSEAVTNDIPEPLKRYMRSLSTDLDDVIADIDATIERRYQIDISDPDIKLADKAVFYWEVQRMIPPEERWKYDAPVPDGIVLPYEWFTPWKHEKAFAHYMDLHTRMTEMINGKDIPDDLQAECS